MFSKNEYVEFNETTNEIIIKNIDLHKLSIRIKSLYEEKNLNKLFQIEYNKFDKFLFERKIIRKSKMKISHIKVHSFFALEVLILFEELYDRYRYNIYKSIVNELKEKTWVGKKVDWKEVPMDTTPLRNITYELKDYQLKFVKRYPSIKENNSLHGVILSFDQGLGKTLTAVSIAECLKKRQVIIVCPNSLKENWSNEIKQYFRKYNDDKLFFNEVFVSDNKKFTFNKNKNKYIIVNQESISKIFPIIDKNRDTIIIVDESHNFRNMQGKRVKELIELKKRTSCEDVLLMSGTPIKALPNEIIPALLLIDPLFDMEAARIYNRMFNVDGLSSANIVKQRFSRVIYRRTKEQVLKLPEKNQKEIILDIKNSEKYTIKHVNELTLTRFKEIYDEKYKDIEVYRDTYVELIQKYSSSPDNHRKMYLNFVISGNAIEGYHEIDQEMLLSYTKNYVLPNIYNSDDLKHFKRAETNYLRLKESCMGKALGEILPKYRASMYISLYEENKKMFLNMIHNNDKKTVIFSTSLAVINYISEDLTKIGMGNVKIVGGTSDRMDKINNFKNDDNINVILATSQTLSTGVTLTEANQMFFFGTPWRSADYEQACDRIHRIGQTSDVNIYRVLLNTKTKNLSSRMNEILGWSEDMFNGFVENK